MPLISAEIITFERHKTVFMKKSCSLPFLSALFICLSACQSQPEYCTVKGSVKGLKDGTRLELLDKFDHYKVIAKTQVKEGAYELRPHVAAPTHVFLYSEDQEQLKDFFLEPGTIIADVDATDEMDYAALATGTPSNDLLYKISQLERNDDLDAAQTIRDSVLNAPQTGILALYMADANGATPPISLEYDKETQIVKVNQWALDFTTFQYTNAAVENVDIVDAETGAVLGTTNALGNARLSKIPACGVAAYPGVSAVAVSDNVGSFTPIQDKYVPPAHDYSIFGGPDGRSLLRILVIGLGLIIPLLIIVLFAYNRELRTAGVKYEDLRGDNEVTRRL